MPLRSLHALALAAAIALPLSAGQAPAQGFDPDAMTAEERAAFGEAVRAYILENPEVVLEAIQILEQRRNQAAEAADAELVAANREAIYDDGFSYVGGNPEGDVTIVEFLDYRCGFCKRAHPEVKALLENDPNLRIIVKEFPILGPDSVVAGRMALAALELEPMRYERLKDELMSFQGQLTETIAYRIADGVGYDIGALKARAAEDDIDEKLAQTYALADALGIQGTPSFVIGGQIARGFLPLEEMEAMVEEARSASN